MPRERRFSALFLVIFLVSTVFITITKADWSCHGACAGCSLLNCTPDVITECCACCPHSQLGRVCCCFPNQGCYALQN